MNSGGLFLTPVANDLNVNMGVLTIYFSISSLVLMLALPILGRFIGKINIKTLIIASVILQGGIFACFGLLSNVWGFYILSIPMAIGTAIPCHILGPVIVNSWFKKNTGLAMGVMMAISGGVSAILQPQITSLIVKCLLDYRCYRRSSCSNHRAFIYPFTRQKRLSSLWSASSC